MGDPIEAYIDRLRARLLARFDVDSVNRVLDEVRAHLSDSADEIAEKGCPGDLAAELAIARFGPADRSALIPNLMAQIGAGDRFWGKVALTVAIAGAIALAVQAILAAPGYQLDGQEATTALSFLLLAFGFASIRARALVPMRATVLGVVSVIAISVLIDGRIDTGEGLLARSSHPEGALRPLVAANLGSWPPSPLDSSLAAFQPDLGSFLAADSGRVLFDPSSLLGVRERADRQDAVLEELPPSAGFVAGAAPAEMISHKGWISESARLSTIWLALLLIAQSCIAWLVGLDRTQRTSDDALVM